MPGDDDGNPFKLPEADQWFFFQEQEVQKREEELERVRHLKVWEKTTDSQRIRNQPRTEEALVAPPPSSLAPSSSRRAISEGPLREPKPKGGIHTYVVNKHEVFRTRQALNEKKTEIIKLKEEAGRREAALQVSQQTLAEDFKRFDELLQSNDQKAHSAMKRAEEVTKRRQEKQQKIKQMKLQLDAMQSEITKLREHKEECLNLKAFLENITPEEWKETTSKEKHERQSLRKNRWVDDRVEISNGQMQADIEAEERAAEERAAEAAKGRRRQRREIEEEEKLRETDLEGRRRRIRKKYAASRDHLESEYADEYGENSSGDDMPPFFQEPKQLLDVFTGMEEANLFLIQNTQDTEQALEELQTKLAETKRTGDEQKKRVNASIAAVEQSKEEERRKCDEFRQKISLHQGACEEEEMMRYLCSKALEVSAACGHEAQAERDPDTLQLLAAAEARLEEFIGVFDEAEATGLAKLVEREEREAETERRKMQKAARKEQQDRKNEERLKASLQRSQAPIHKKTGKQIMFRSPPVYTAQRVVQEDDGYEEAVKQHRVFGIWTDKDGAPQVAQPVKPT